MLIAGDLLCARSISDSTASAVREGFRRLARASIFAAVVPGEAEEVHSLAMLRQVCSEPNVHLFSGEEWSRVSPLAGVSVWGLRTTSRNSTTNALGNLVIEGPGIHLGLMHTTFAGQPGFVGRRIGGIDRGEVDDRGEPFGRQAIKMRSKQRWGQFSTVWPMSPCTRCCFLAQCGLRGRS